MAKRPAPWRCIRPAIWPREADRFEMDPADHFAAQRKRPARAGQAIIGCYHSHPDWGGRAIRTPTSRRGRGEIFSG